ncbi:thymidine kinase 2, mitochondrial [Patella vulgata]|uniref:thymidine kinase 2, mitochondrial n=1 Tax=Patella vulgata TaxID=6465 RepID=UPI0021804696|nr:thymidine kinase 2, mitochondrial [Patella vulgata]
MIGSDAEIFPNICTEYNDTFTNKSEDDVCKEKKSVYSVAVEGNIGCGKSTFLNYFKKFLNVEVLVEPVEKWKCIRGFNSLDLMYKDATRWSSAFQSYVTLTMLQNHHSLKDDMKVRMTERSVYSARYCFIENLHQSKLMPEVDYAMLCEWHDWIKTNAEAQLDLIVYLKASPETCLQRIEERNRNEEKGVPLDYLKTLHRLHEDWLIKKSHGKLPCKVLEIDTEGSKEMVLEKIKLFESTILCDVTPQIS